MRSSENAAHIEAAFPYGRWWEREASSGSVSRVARIPDDDPPADYRTGDSANVPGAGKCDANTVNDPNCRTFTPICGMRRIGAIVRGVAGPGAWAIPIAPNASQWFLPRAVRMQVTSNANPAVAQWVFITGVAINNFPQESVHTVPAVAGTLAGFSSENYVAPDGFGVPVPWGIISQVALIENLVVNGWNFFGVAADVQVAIWGHPLTCCPQGCEVGKIMTEAHKDEIAASYSKS